MRKQWQKTGQLCLLSSGCSHTACLSQLKKCLLLPHATEDKISSCSMPALVLRECRDSCREGWSWLETETLFQAGSFSAQCDLPQSSQKDNGNGKEVAFQKAACIRVAFTGTQTGAAICFRISSGAHHPRCLQEEVTAGLDDRCIQRHALWVGWL